MARVVTTWVALQVSKTERGFSFFSDTTSTSTTSSILALSPDVFRLETNNDTPDVASVDTTHHHATSDGDESPSQMVTVDCDGDCGVLRKVNLLPSYQKGEKFNFQLFILTLPWVGVSGSIPSFGKKSFATAL